jgi:hypothetical protein
MEFLRFGSSIPGSYWGCCAVDIIQNFKYDPDEKAAIQLVSGDGGGPLTHNSSELFVGPTYRDIFMSRLRIGTFDSRDMPNHGFLAVMTQDQIRGSKGLTWLKILRETGFEFIRTVSNSVYSGQNLKVGGPDGEGNSLNHIFGLFRNIGTGGPADPFTPPTEWSSLPHVKTEACQSSLDPRELARLQFAEDLAVWNKIGAANLMSMKKVKQAGIDPTMAGLRSQFPQQSKTARDLAKSELKSESGVEAQKANPFLEPESEPIEDEEDYYKEEIF